MSLAVRPAPQLAVELFDQVQSRGRLLGSNQPPDFPKQAEDVVLGWPDQEFASILPDVSPKEVEPILDVRDLRLLRREAKTTFPEKGRYGG